MNVIKKECSKLRGDKVEKPKKRSINAPINNHCIKYARMGFV